MDGQLVYIILLNYKGYEDTTACIRSLRKIEYADYKIVVVDNCSGDGSYEKLKEENKDCVCILSPENNGFSAGNNIGIRYAFQHGADFVLMLNNDTEVKEDFLAKMVEASDGKTVVTPSIYYYSEPNEIWYADGRINFNRCTVSNGDDHESKYCDYASGCCLLIPRKVYEAVGDWAEEYFMYYEDMDYSLRVNNGGFKIFYEKDAVVYHKVGRSSGRGSKLRIYYNVRNRFYVIKKFNFSRACWIYTVVTRLIRGVSGIIKDSNEKITFAAISDYHNNRMGKSNRGW